MKMQNSAIDLVGAIEELLPLVNSVFGAFISINEDGGYIRVFPKLVGAKNPTEAEVRVKQLAKDLCKAWGPTRVFIRPDEPSTLVLRKGEIDVHIREFPLPFKTEVELVRKETAVFADGTETSIESALAVHEKKLVEEITSGN